MIYELDITVGDIRRAIGRLPNSTPLKFRYGEVESDNIFARVDGIEACFDTSERHAGVLLTVSLIDEEASEDEDDDEDTDWEEDDDDDD